ncbi:MAG: N-formylglutamate amidohydrolase [Fibrobacter sp.]|mgnify:FL=1|nr:N-formylglutamate amidohydrolase [Fibrobacter sp.]
MKNAIVITCEHGGNLIPEQFQFYFEGKEELLSSHRGWDPGALDAAEYCADISGCKLICENVSRLLIEQNRSPASRNLYSEISKNFSGEIKDHLFSEIYIKYHRRVEDAIVKGIEECGRVNHFSIHSFTPVFNGVERNADIGILYDPSREPERLIAGNMKKNLEGAGFNVRRNYPYRGISDGVSSWLRGMYGEKVYSGIEVEINQKFYYGDQAEWKRVLKRLGECVWEFSTGGKIYP